MRVRQALTWGMIVAAGGLWWLACAAPSDRPTSATARAEGRTGEPERDDDRLTGPRSTGKVRVSGRVTHVTPFCGGAMLAPEERSRREAPTPDRRPYVVRSGAVNNDLEPLARIVADETGAFEISLEPGTYCFVSEAKKVTVDADSGAVPSPHVDARCMADYRLRCDHVFTVGDTDVRLELKLRDPCFYGPCYRGPLPS